MHKLIVALTAVLITGLAGFSVAGGDAQEAEKSEEGPHESSLLKMRLFHQLHSLGEDEETEGVYIQRAENPREAATRLVSLQHGEAGTWQIVNVNNLAILLNTATGETFSLDKGDDGLRWKPIHRPMPEMPAMYRFADPRKRDMPDMKSLEEKLEGLRKELRNAKGEAREKLEKAIEELERNRDRKDVEPERKRDQDNAENQLREIEETIETLRKRFEESDSVKEREKIERTIKDLKEKAENLRKERKKDR